MEIRKSCAFVLPWSIDVPGGVNHVVKNLIEEFRESNEYHPILIENHWPSVKPIVVESCPNFTHIRMRLRSLDNTNIKVPLVFLLTLPLVLWRLKQIARAYCIEVLNIHFPGLDTLVWIVLRNLHLFPCKVILSFHGSDIRSAYKLRGWPRAIYRLLLRQADAVVSCSEGLQSEVLAIEMRIKGHVIYNGINEQRFIKKSITKPTVQKELLLNIGRYEYRKGHDLLLYAFARVLEEQPDLHLVIVGTKGPEFENTNALVQSMGLSSYVTMYHDLPHTAIPSLLNAARIFVLSSRWVPGKVGEGFPIAILEAAAACKPVVTTRTCGAAEIIDDCVTGRLVPLENVDELAEAICDLLKNRESAQRMAENLQQKVHREFTWKRAYAAYCNLMFSRET